MESTSVVVRSLPRHTTSFIGRHHEIASIRGLLNKPDCQLLTLLGPGGIGKTRLAIEVARQMGACFAHGVYYVALQPLHSTDQMLHAITNTLGLLSGSAEHALRDLLAYLSDKTLLLVLDNFEHLPDGASLVAEMLVAAPALKILVTSRETLNLHEEWLWEVRGLRYPLPGEPADPPESYSAVQLFTERARQGRPDFALAAHSAAVVRICQLVEGMPLALELAAHWIKTLSCDAIAAEIQRDIDFLAGRMSNIPERHRSTRAVFNHSWRLLFDEERSAFPLLTVFRGSFTREAAEQISGVPLSILASLVDKSLVRQDGLGRYDIHELLRQFGEEKLAASGAVEALKDRHAAYFARLVAQCERDLKGSAPVKALDTLANDFDNARIAWTHAAARRDFALIDSMIDGLFLYVRWRSRLVEGQALFDAACAALAPAPGEAAHPVWGRVLVRAQDHTLAAIEQAIDIARAHASEADIAYGLLARGWQQCQQRSFTHALRDLQDSLDLCRALGDQYGMVHALAQLTHVNLAAGRWDTAVVTMTQGLRLAQEIGNAVWEHTFLFYAGWAACFDGRYDEGERLLRQAERMAEMIGFRQMAADHRGGLGFVAFVRGDLAQARALIADDLAVSATLRASGEQGFALILLAHIACVEEDYQRARQWAEDALELVRPHVVRERFIARVLAMAACGEGDFAQARRQIHTVLSEETRPGIRLLALPVVALLQADEGHFRYAAELLGLSFNHPASARGWQERWPLIARLREQLEAHLGADAYAAAWNAGALLDLDTVIEQGALATGEQARQPLAEALTARELDVLRLVAEGLSNRDIAGALTIGEGTVRTHIYNLCQKLDARNRTQAIARARALRLL